MEWKELMLLRFFFIEDIKEKKIENIKIILKNTNELKDLKNILLESGNTKVSFNYYENGKFFVFKLKNNKKINSETIKSIEKQGFLTEISNL